MMPFHHHIDRLSESHLAPNSIRCFRLAIYLFLLYNTVVLCLPIVNELWGVDSLVMPLKFNDLWTNKIFMALHYPGHESWHWPLLLTQLLGLLMIFKKKWTTLSAVLVYVSTILLFNRLFLFTIGGNLLVHLMLFYLLFMAEHVHRESRFGSERILLSNLFFLAARLQLLIVYFVSAGYKLFGATWRNGEAVGYVLNIEEFSTPWMMDGIGDVTWLTTILTYASLIYLLTFPLLVWWRAIKPYLLIFGICFHLGLGWAVGVMDFSLVMIICYLLFFEERWSIALTKNALIKKLIGA